MHLRKSITDRLNFLMYNQICKKAIYFASEVTLRDGLVDYGRVDYVVFDQLKTWRFYEVKSSIEDFKSKAKWTFMGNYNYFIMPVDVYEKVKADIPSNVGVYVANKDYTKLKNVKKSKYKELPIAERIYFNRFIVSLSRDANKYYTLKNDDTATIIRRNKNEINRLGRELKRTHSNYVSKNHEVKILKKLLMIEGYTREEVNNKLDQILYKQQGE